MSNEMKIELTILMPCLNEADTVGNCIAKAREFLLCSQVQGEILIADNGSIDSSKEIALSLGARVVDVLDKGYGAALIGGIEAAEGSYIIMGDADDSYDFTALMPFLEKLRQGFDLVMGNRFRGGIKPGAMPFLHRYVGNPILSFVGRLFFKSGIGDFHSGLRGFRRDSILALDLQTTGMEFASEMVVKASLNQLRVAEVPITLYPDGRSRPPHLRSFRDGWRHLRFLLIYSPTWLFLYPGLILFIAGSLLSFLLFFGPLNIGFRYIDFHTFIVTGTLMFLGMNMISFAIITRLYAFQNGLLPVEPRFFTLFKYLNLEKGLAIGFAILLVGLVVMIRALLLSSGFEQMGFDTSVRLVFGGSLVFLTGAQIVLASFVLSILGLRIRKK